MNRREFIKATGIATLGLMIDGQPFTEARRSVEMKVSAVKLFDGGFNHAQTPRPHRRA